MTALREPKVALLVLPESTPASIYGLYEVFQSVGQQWEALTGEAAAVGRIYPRIVAKDGVPPPSTLGLPITPHGGLEAADIIIVADLAFTAEFDPRGRWPTETAWLCDRYEAGAVVCSVCTGTLALAEAGLLDGEMATTHWAASGLIEAHYPKVRLAPQRILTASGDGARILPRAVPRPGPNSRSISSRGSQAGPRWCGRRRSFCSVITATGIFHSSVRERRKATTTRSWPMSRPGLLTTTTSVIPWPR